MTRPESRTRSRLILVAKLAVTAGLLAAVFVLNRDQIRAVRSRTPDLGRLALGFACYGAGLMLAFGRWLMLVRAQEEPMRLREGLRLGFIGNFFNLVIPGAVGGDLVKVAYLFRMGMRKAPAIASVAIDRLVGLSGLFLLAGAVGAWSWGVLDPRSQRLVAIVWFALGGLAAVLTVAFSPSLVRPAVRWLEGRGRRAPILNGLATTGALYRRRLGVVALGLVFATITHTLNVLAFYEVSRALYPTVPTLAQHFLMVPLVLFTTAVPLPFGALGLSEGVSLELFRLADYAGGAVAMMGFRVLQFAWAVPSGVVYLANLRQVHELEEAAEELADSGEPEVLNHGDTEARNQVIALEILDSYPGGQ